MATKKVRADDMRAEYDVRALKNQVRGKYHARASAGGGNVVLLDPDVATAFPNAKSVNDALRGLMKLARAKVRMPRST